MRAAAAVGLVAQAPVMLEGDVRANLAYGLEAPALAALDEALAATGLDPSFMDRSARELYRRRGGLGGACAGR